MKFLSVCSGIEAASVAWTPLGWSAVAFSEIEPFPCAVLAHHYPNTPNWGDMTKFKDWPDVSIDLLCGGTPCQSFSVAGLRKGLDDPRGNLMLTFGAIAAKYRPQWLVWENVPGVLSANEGRDFASFLGLITGQEITVPAGGWQNSGIISGIDSAYGVAYRVLDAQYFGVAQRRRRVFVVGYLGDWRSAAAVLFERHSMSGNPAPRRQAGKGFATDAAPSLVASGRGVERTGETRGQDPVIAVAHVDVMPTVRAGAANGGAGHGARSGDSKDELIVPVRTLCVATGQAGAEIGADMAPTLNCNHEAPYVVAGVTPFDTTQMTSVANRSNPKVGDPCHPLAAGAHAPCIAFPERLSGTQCARTENLAPSMGAANPTAVAYTTKLHNTTSNQAGKVYEEYTVGLDRNSPPPALLTAMQVRRLTPVECARLQGFPDHYLDITVRGKPAADGPKYKSLGNSWAVPNVRWIGQRIDAVALIQRSREAIEKIAERVAA